MRIYFWKSATNSFHSTKRKMSRRNKLPEKRDKGGYSPVTASVWNTERLKVRKNCNRFPFIFCRLVLQNGNVCWVFPDKGGRKRGKERKEMFFQISDPISSRTTKTCGLVLLVASTTWCWTYCKQSPHRLWLVAPAHRSAPSCPYGHDTSASGE